MALVQRFLTLQVRQALVLYCLNRVRVLVLVYQFLLGLSFLPSGQIYSSFDLSYLKF